MTSLSTFVATRLRQPWRDILSVLNRSLTGKDTSWDTTRLPILQILWGIIHSANLVFESFIWDEFEWQAVDRTIKPSKMSKLMYTRFTKLIIDHFLSCNKSIPHRSDSDMHSEGQDLPLTKMTNTIKAKKAESEKTKAADEPKEQHVSPVRSGRGKGYMCSGDQEANVLNAFKKNVVPKKTRSYTVADNIVEEPIIVELAKSISPVVEDPTVQSLLDLRKGSKASRLESLKDDETNDSDNSNMDSSEDEPNSLLYETPVHELMDLISNPVYIDAHTTLVVANPERNPEKLEALTSNNVSKVIKKVVQEKVLTKMKKLLPTHVLKAVANYVKPRLNNSVREVMQNNQISLFTKSSTSADDLSEIDLKLKMVNKIHSNKSNKTHTTHQKLYDTLYESICINQAAIDAQDAEPF
ncbi:hypothetical protein Tco_0344279 [Tanacetum coccineum]